MKIKGVTDVFFDLDHTLWDFDRNSALTFEKIFELNEISISVVDFLEHYRGINLKYWKLYRENKIEKEALRFGRLKEAFLAVNFEADDDLVFKLANDYMDYLTTFNHLFENVVDVLTYLNLNYNLHIITNGFEEVQQKKLTKSNINQYFKTITNSEMAGVKKPNPKIFNYALQLADTSVDKSIMIGDSYEADILGAKKIGMDAIFFNLCDDHIDTNIKQIGNLMELKKYL